MKKFSQLFTRSELLVKTAEGFPFSWYEINYPLGVDWVREKSVGDLEVYPWNAPMDSAKAQDLKYQGFEPTLVFENSQQALDYYMKDLKKEFANFLDEDFLKSPEGIFDKEKNRRWRDEFRRRNLTIPGKKRK